MGELFRARDTRAGRTVAIRIVANEIAGDPQRRLRFVADARAMTALSHPNIAALYEVDEDQGRLFLVSEYVPGDMLTTLIAGRALNPRHALDHGIQLADALAEAHAAGVVHRDIRPSTVIVTPKGIAKFVDVGLAAWTEGGLRRAAASSLLARDAVVAPDAVAYTSPEQLLGKSVDEQSDVFSLGVVLYELLAGRPPFAGADARVVATQIVKAEAAPPSRINRAVSADLDAIVLKMLAKKPDQRYESAATLAAELRAVAAILDVREDKLEPMMRAKGSTSRPGVRPGIWVALAVIAIAALLLMAIRFLFSGSLGAVR